MTAVQFPRRVKKETQPMSQVIGDELLLKDLSDEEFRARYQCDTFTATVLANRFRYIVKQMSTGLLTRAFSVILRDRSEEHTSELQSLAYLVCRLLLEKKK